MRVYKLKCRKIVAGEKMFRDYSRVKNKAEYNAAKFCKSQVILRLGVGEYKTCSMSICHGAGLDNSIMEVIK